LSHRILVLRPRRTIHCRTPPSHVAAVAAPSIAAPHPRIAPFLHHPLSHRTLTRCRRRRTIHWRTAPSHCALAAPSIVAPHLRTEIFVGTEIFAEQLATATVQHQAELATAALEYQEQLATAAAELATVKAELAVERLQREAAAPQAEAVSLGLVRPVDDAN